MEKSEKLESLSNPLSEARKSHGKCKRERRRVLSGLKEILNECLSAFDEKDLALRKMKHKLTKFDAYKSVNRAHKDLHGRISKVRKVVQNVSSGIRCEDNDDEEEENDSEIRRDIARAVSKHLRRSGRGDIADVLIKDQDEKEEDEERKYDRYSNLVKLMNAVENRNLSFLLSWTSENKESIRNGAPYSDIEFRLQSLKFREIAKQNTPTDAILYARTEMRVFCNHASDKMQHLMTSLLFTNEERERRQDDTTWTRIGEEMEKCACRVLKIPHRCPLRTAVQAGVLVMPTLKKFRNVVRDSEYVDTLENLHTSFNDKHSKHTKPGTVQNGNGTTRIFPWSCNYRNNINITPHSCVQFLMSRQVTKRILRCC